MHALLRATSTKQMLPFSVFMLAKSTSTRIEKNVDNTLNIRLTAKKDKKYYSRCSHFSYFIDLHMKFGLASFIYFRVVVLVVNN